MRLLLASFVLLGCAFLNGGVIGSAQQGVRISPDVYDRLLWRHIGPEGNRISAVAGVTGQALGYYAGSALKDWQARSRVASSSSGGSGSSPTRWRTSAITSRCGSRTCHG